MNVEDARLLANELAHECGIKKLRKHKQPTPCLLKDVGIDKEGYGLFYEEFRSSKSGVQSCIIFFIKTRELDSLELENNLIIF